MLNKNYPGNESFTITLTDLWYPALNHVKEAIKTGKWESLSLTPYKLATNELTVNHENGIILQGNKIVIPESLQKRAIALAHGGHMGLVKTKSLLQEKVWFPNIDKLAKERIENCLPCQSMGPANPPEPLHMNKMQKGHVRQFTWTFLVLYQVVNTFLY